MRVITSLIISLVLAGAPALSAQSADTAIVIQSVTEVMISEHASEAPHSPLELPHISSLPMSKGKPVSIYELPYSLRQSSPDWHRMWLNTAVYAGAFVGTLFVLECLPEDATSWNRSELRKDPPQKRWFKNVFKRGPEWDHDNPIFNFVLHPYAGAVYFMSARSSGFNFYQSLLYCACISTIGWEFGIEACMERPSYQDIFITPLVGSVIGELFYKLKRHIVSHNYRLWGSPVLGNVIAFFIDPVNEVLGYFGNSNSRHLRSFSKGPQVTSSFMPSVSRSGIGFSFACTF